MNQGMSTVVSAVVGGIVGAAVVFFAGGKGDTKNLNVENLKVSKLTVTDQAALLNKEGKEEVVIKEGSVFAENLVLGRKFIGTQFQGHAMVANRVYATPDNLFTTPMEQWRFYAELGASKDAGGEMVVRSIAGPALVNRPTTDGALFRMGFDTESRPQILGISNPDRSPVPINYELSDRQRQQIMSAAAGGGAQAQGGFDSNTSMPLTGFQGNNAVIPPSQSSASAPNPSGSTR